MSEAIVPPTSRTGRSHLFALPWWVLGGLGCLLGFIWLMSQVTGNVQIGLDQEVDALLAHSHEPVLTLMMRAASLPGTQRGAVVIALASGWLAWARGRDLIVSLLPVGANFLAVGLADVIKPMVDRVPPYRLTGSVLPEHGLAFPSAHVAVAVAVAGTSIGLLRGRLPPRLRLATLVAGLVSMVGVAVSVMYLHRHWLTDVVGGLLLGCMIVTLLTPIAQRRRNSTPSTSLDRRVGTIPLPFPWGDVPQGAPGRG
jgi:undecaprenyl-diphosphatase